MTRPRPESRRRSFPQDDLRRESDFEPISLDFQNRAAQLGAVADLLATSLHAPPPTHLAKSCRASDPHAHHMGASPPNVTAAGQGGASSTPTGERSPDELTTESWQRRQIELLERIDESLRRLRELQETSRPTVSLFAEPAYS